MTTRQQTNLIRRLLVGVSILFLVPVAVVGQTIIGQASGNGTIPSGEYAGQSCDVSIRGEYSDFGFGTLITGEATVVIGTEIFVSIVSPDVDTFQSFCCGEGHVYATEFSVYGQVRHTTAAIPHNHLFAASGTSDGQVMCFNIADQSGTVVTPIDPPHNPGVGLICDIPAQVQIEQTATQVAIDIKPMSCPNTLNVNSKGVLSVAILSTDDFDVIDIDVSGLTLEGVPPIRFDIEDVATPFDGEPCDCHEDGSDGYLDLTLKFDTQEIVDALGSVANGEERELYLTGELLDGTPLVGSDCIRIIYKDED